jgi:hypothetical protein
MTITSRSLATPTTVPGWRGGWRRTTVPSADGSTPGSGELVARAKMAIPFSFANSTACAFSTFAPDSASSWVSSYDSVPIRFASDTTRGSAV